jgi:hypothetical protein
MGNCRESLANRIEMRSGRPQIITIQCLKKSLKRILQDQAPVEEVMHTILTKLAHTINSRPLTHVSIDPRDEEALIPNHFLIGSPLARQKYLISNKSGELIAMD